MMSNTCSTNTTTTNGSHAEAGSDDEIFAEPMEVLTTTHTVGKEIGRGRTGPTYLCAHKVTGELFACKTIVKMKLRKNDTDDVLRSVQIMHHLAGQPNIVQLKGLYEDGDSVRVVKELCAGGEILDRIIAKGYHTERAAASLLRNMIQAIHSCHTMGVMHRDIKLENFMFLNNDENSPLKLVDFNLSSFHRQGEMFDLVTGSPSYVAPEVLKKKYGPEIDIWSAGAALYTLLYGVPPFWPETERGKMKKMVEGQYDLSSDPWPSISASAKGLVTKMLSFDPKQRPTAYQVLNHPWIKEDGEAADKPLDNIVMNRFKLLRAYKFFHIGVDCNIGEIHRLSFN
ncbi:calcium-dependent protein kinase 2-like [Prosopis cineraria]|uniref:calcium-dependent protein kinase 2-like n=1 Tax=Prosopis cineraria TaxID=364024 RepID=UPI00240FA244|nr:calcium-dependent protein kinase 2-like [Prosopis cineraria]